MKLAVRCVENWLRIEVKVEDLFLGDETQDDQSSAVVAIRCDVGTQS